MHITQQNHLSSSIPPAVVDAGNPGNLAAVEAGTTAAQKPLVDSKTIRREFNSLKEQLIAHVPAIVAAKATIEELIPRLARVEALLSQRGADRKALKGAHLPTWSSFLSGFAARVGYSSRQLRNLIRGHREPRKMSRGPKSPTCKPVLSGLLNWIDISGDHVPVILIDALRNAKNYLEGRKTLRQWKDMEQDLQERYRRQQAASSAAQLATETPQLIVHQSYLM